jgi:Carboxypeptidase regulatory-like domain
MTMSKGRALVLALGLLAACQKSNSDQTVHGIQEPSIPTGSIVGRVTSLRTGGPLAGAKVSVSSPAGVTSAVTDAGGQYILGKLPAGAAYEVRFELAGYVTCFGVAPLPDAAGDFPQGNATVVLDAFLAQPDAAIRGTIVAYAGLPVSGAVVRADLRGLGFDLVKEVTTDAAGAYQIAGLPGSPQGIPVPVTVAPFDANADGVPDYGSLTTTVKTYPAATSLEDLDLRTVAYGLELVTSDLETGLHDPATALHFTFNRDLSADTTVTLHDDTANRYVAVLSSTSGTLLQVAPSGGTPLANAHAFTVSVYGVADNGTGATVTRTFVAAAGGGLLTAPALTVSPTSADSSTTSFQLSWPAIGGAKEYRVYARDTHANPSYLLLQTVLTSPSPKTSVSLPAVFDWYGGDLVQTPFLFRTTVDFVVVAVDVYGDAVDPGNVTPVTLVDATPPTGWFNQTGSANNSAGTTTKEITLKLTFSEYMDTAALPTITFSNASVTASPFVYDTTTSSGTFQVTVPAGLDAVGVTYSVQGASDTSGNGQVTLNGALAGLSQVLVNGGFEGAISPWSTNATSSSTAPVLTTVVASSGSSSLAIGNFTTSVQSGQSYVYQDVTIPAWATSITVSARYWPQTNYPYYGHDYNACDVRTPTSNTPFASVFNSYQQSSTWLSASTTLSASYAGQTIRIYCYTYQDGSHITGMYLDDVAVTVTL